MDEILKSLVGREIDVLTDQDLAEKVIDASNKMKTPGTAKWHTNALAADRLARAYLKLRTAVTGYRQANSMCPCIHCRNMDEALNGPNKTDYDFYEFLEKRFKILYEAIEEIAFYGTSRPVAMGSEDDGDGWYKRIAYALISKAAIARHQCR